MFYTFRYKEEAVHKCCFKYTSIIFLTKVPIKILLTKGSVMAKAWNFFNIVSLVFYNLIPIEMENWIVRINSCVTNKHIICVLFIQIFTMCASRQQKCPTYDHCNWKTIG
jgi:hypothetical protein